MPKGRGGGGTDKNTAMAGTGELYIDAEKRSKRRNRIWYQTYLMNALKANKEKQVREVDASIALTKELLELLDEKLPLPVEVPLREVVPSEDDRLMAPIEPEVLDLLLKSTEKGAVERYLKERNKKAPEDKFYFRACSNWDYGWQQKQSRVRARDVNKGRCKILRETFYRKNNVAPDPSYYAQPSGGEISICSEYTCNFGSPGFGPNTLR